MTEKGEALASFTELTLFQAVQNSHEGQSLMAAMPDETRKIVLMALVVGCEVALARPEFTAGMLRETNGAFEFRRAIAAMGRIVDQYQITHAN